MSDFLFIGNLHASKSLMNRALIVQSFFPYLKFIGENHCNDVRFLLRGLDQLHRGKEIDCGAGGTTFRFLAVRASRQPGRHVLKGDERLFSRPQSELTKIFNQLGVKSEFQDQALVIESEGWRPMGDGIHVHNDRSSQFASALLLSAWELKFPLALSLSSNGVSLGYFEMTKSFVRQLGMQWESFGNDISIPAQSKATVNEYTVETDMSSAFAVASLAAVDGQARFTHFPKESLQPDYSFVTLMQDMGVDLTITDKSLEVRKAGILKGGEWDMTHSPDLVPVAAVLAALASGASTFSGAPHLKFKESDRITKTVELVEKMGRNVSATEEGLIIHEGEAPQRKQPFEFDPDQDHRLAMAVGVAMRAGYEIDLKHPEVVSKSFPDFWKVAGL